MKQSLLFALSILAISALRAQQPPQLDDSQPGEVFLTPQVDLALQPVPLIVPDKFKGQVPEGEVLNLPEGFTASVFAATGLVGPRFMDWSPDGVLHVANMKVNGSEWAPTHDTSTPPAADQMFAQIVALPDRDQDGVADTVLVVAEGLWFPHSLQFYQGDLYVGDMHQVVRLRDGDGDGVYEERTVVIGDLPAGHHRTRTLLIDKTTDKLYLSVGSSCDLCRETDERRATLLQADPDGSNLRVYARGLRNAIGMAFHPLTRQLWITGNGHDQEGDHLPPEAVTVVEDGGFYGWPLAYGYQVPVDFGIRKYRDEIFPLTRQDTLDVESMVRPTIQVPAHLAPMGIYFNTHDRFPPQYKHAAFVALRGNGRDEVGQKVIVIFSEPDGSQARVGDFLTGFERNSRGDTWGKPVGLIGDANGSLYLSSDWINNLIVKIEPPPGSTAIEEYGEALPAHFALRQNYPNPFNGTTAIRFDLPTPHKVRLAVYNLAGQKVVELVRGTRGAGSYALAWDGRDQNGRLLASGVYLYRLEAGDQVRVRKLLLLQ